MIHTYGWKKSAAPKGKAKPKQSAAAQPDEAVEKTHWDDEDPDEIDEEEGDEEDEELEDDDEWWDDGKGPPGPPGPGTGGALP